MPKPPSPTKKKPTAEPANVAQRPTKQPKPDLVIDGTKANWFKQHKKQLIIATAALVAIGASALAFYAITHRGPKVIHTNSQAKVVTAPPKPKTMPSPLTGVEVSPERAEHPVVSVVVENLYPDARPQSGLSSAGIVYEALAEGGITRYQALFGDTMPPDIGPVRSLRTYFLRWGLEYNVPVVHAGGNADALDLVTPLGMKNLDQFTNGSYFRRISSRYAPHNLYTTGDQLDALMKARGFDDKPSFTPWPRKDDAKSATPTASTITIDPSYYDYQITYHYDPTDNSYARSIRGIAQVDANGNAPIKPKNVVVLKAATSYGLTRSGEQTVIIGTVGSGSGVVFQDGVATEITWSKVSDKAETLYRDAAGKPIKFNRGQTWVTVIPTIKTVTYQ